MDSRNTKKDSQSFPRVYQHCNAAMEGGNWRELFEFLSNCWISIIIQMDHRGIDRNHHSWLEKYKVYEIELV